MSGSRRDGRKRLTSQWARSAAGRNANRKAKELKSIGLDGESRPFGRPPRWRQPRALPSLASSTCARTDMRHDLVEARIAAVGPVAHELTPEILQLPRLDPSRQQSGLQAVQAVEQVMPAPQRTAPALRRVLLALYRDERVHRDQGSRGSGPFRLRGSAFLVEAEPCPGHAPLRGRIGQRQTGDLGIDAHETKSPLIPPLFGHHG